MSVEKEAIYEELVQISDNFFEKFVLKKLEEKNNILSKKEQFFCIMLKLYNMIKNNTDISFTKEEIKFILDYDIYRGLKEIIEELRKIC